MVAVVLISPLSRAECVQRLRDRVGDRFARHKPVIGHVKETAIWIEKRIGYRNSFSTRLRADLVEDGHATRIRCKIGMRPLVLGFVAIWFTFVAGGLIVTALQRHPGFYVPLTMLIFGACLVAFGRFLARNEARDLIDFLERGLNAREVTVPPDGPTRPGS